MIMDEVFRALSDANRRFLLDQLRASDGQTLSELESKLSMTRFGVMKHLKILEEASLVVTRKVGRHKYHYLNPIPIQEISERWISAYAQPWVTAMSKLKNNLERSNSFMTAQTTVKPRHIFTTIIQTTPEKLWQALTTPEMTRQYFFGNSLQSDLKVGADFNYFGEDGTQSLAGKILEWEPPTRLVVTFSDHLRNADSEREAPSTVIYEIEAAGDCCRLTLIHEGFAGETPTYQRVGNGWPIVLSGLKTLLETGKPLKYDLKPCSH